jgi:hypothetical protein
MYNIFVLTLNFKWQYGERVCKFPLSLHMVGRSCGLTKREASVCNGLESVSALTFLQGEKACAEF